MKAMGVNKCYFGVAILAIAIGLSNQRAATPDPSKGNANEYMDKLLTNVREMILDKSMDPYTAIDFSLFGVHLTGDLHGLSSLHRGGDASLKSLSDGSIEIEGVFSVYSLTADFNYGVRLLFVPINGKAGGAVDEVQTRVVMKTNMETRRLVVTKLKVEYMGRVRSNVEVPFTVSFINRVINLVSDAIANVFKTIVVRLLEGTIRGYVQQTIDTMMPPMF